MTIAALLALLNQEQPDVVRHPAPWIPHTARKRQELTMSQPIPAPRTAPAAPELRAVAPAGDEFQRVLQAEALPLGKLLSWAAAHDDKTVRAHAEKAKGSLDALRARHQADNELAAIDSETAELEQRLAELAERRSELAPKRARAAGVRDHDPAIVRAWAREQGIDVPNLGRVPKTVVEAWRKATGGTT